MKKIFFIISLTMLCYGCIDKNNEVDNNKHSYFVQHHDEHIEIKIDTINKSKYDNVIKIDTAIIKKNIDRYIKKRMFISGYSGVKEVVIKERINTYGDYLWYIDEVKLFGLHKLRRYAYHSDMWGGEKIDWNNPDLHVLVDKHDWLTIILYYINTEAKISKISEELFESVYICECKLECTLPFDNIQSTMIMNVILDNKFNVHMLSEFELFDENGCEIFF